MNGAVCGQNGHTKRSCPQAGMGKDARVSAIRARMEETGRHLTHALARQREQP
jgi:hypothetical protein